jgi:hypothetical protein
MISPLLDTFHELIKSLREKAQPESSSAAAKTKPTIF